MRRIVRDLQGIQGPIPTSTWALLLGTAVAFVGLVGCGRPATKADCDEIFDKSAQIELKLQNVTDPAEVKKRTDAVRTARGEEILKKCIGRRVTEKALACVRNATTAEQVDRCLD